MKITDLHNHTLYSYDGSNTCTEIINNAIANSISVIGISDHQFSVRGRLREYISEINALKQAYKGKINIKCGLEIGTRPYPDDLIIGDANKLDYCLFESLDTPKGMDLYEFEQWCALFTIPKGLAHTDIFSLQKRYGLDIFDFMKKNNLFWELNTSGNYTYYYDFITNREKQKLLSESGITVSIGSDTHWTRDFVRSKLFSAHELIEKLGNPIIFS